MIDEALGVEILPIRDHPLGHGSYEMQALAGRYPGVVGGSSPGRLCCDRRT